jgi:ribosome biogenesis protein ENP2
LAPFQLSSSVSGINAIDVNPVHGLIGLGTENNDGKGTVEFWDHRARAPAGILQLPFAKLSGVSGSWDDSSMSVSVTALASRLDGLTVAVGTSTGHTLLYDLRAPLAHTTKDQGYGLPIKKIEWPTSVAASGFSQTEGLVATADSKVVKIWSRHTTDNLISVNPLAPINDMHIYPDSGLVFLANEASPMTGYFIPSLGPAPRWCRFLENMTEEMEDSQEVAVYDDYKFVSDAELTSLSLDHLVGTPALRPYMHGYFIDLRLYAKAKAIANPFAYVEHRDKLIKEKIQKEQESRIRASKLKTKSNESKSTAIQNVKINKDLAEKIIEQEQASVPSKAQSKKSKAKNIPSGSLLTDDRFGDLFTNEDFEIDKFSREYAALNPSSAATARNQVTELNEEELSDSDSEKSVPQDLDDPESEDSSEDDDVWKKRDRRQMSERKKQTQQERTRPGRGADRSEETSATYQVPHNKPRMYINADNDQDSSRLISDLDTRDKTFGQKLSHKKDRQGEAGTTRTESSVSQNETLRALGGGSMEFSFNPTSSATSQNQTAKKVQPRSKPSESFGIGLSKGSIARDQEEKFIESLDQDNLSGRTRKRKVQRSASKSKIRKL